jgi:cytosine/adenosine deaminase-related metal-dependent hydrolase
MTTVQDMLTLYPYEDRHMDAVMKAYEQVGIRVVFALQYADRRGIETIPFWKDTFPADLHPLLSTAAEPERQLDLIGHFETTRLRSPPPRRASWALGPSAPERCSPALMQRTVALARRYDIPIYTHIYESRGMALQARLSLPEYSGLLIRRLAEEGVLDRRLNFAHSVWLSREEIELLAERDAGVVLNPQGNLKMKCGIAPIRALQDAGVRIGLGCDSCSCSDAQNMFMAMKLFALLAAVIDPIPGPPQAVAALHAATEGGAESARLGDVLGRIAPGFKADLTLIDMQHRGRREGASRRTHGAPRWFGERGQRDPLHESQFQLPPRHCPGGQHVPRAPYHGGPSVLSRRDGSRIHRYAKARPGRINMASAGIGTISHMAGELFNMMTGILLTHVPYRGAASAVTDLLGGQIQLMFDNAASSTAHIRAGRLRPIAVTTSTRVDALPEVPTVAEFVQGYEASIVNGIGVPARTPADIVAKINAEVDGILGDPFIKARFAELGGTAMIRSPADYRIFLAEETDKWARVVKAAGLNPS